MTKKIVGRPRLGANKLQKIPTWFKESEIKKIKKEAGKYEMTFSSFVRAIILREVN